MKSPAGYLLLAVLFMCVVRSAVADAPPADGSSLLVLQNGEVFAGRVTWAGDSYYVQTPGRQLTFARQNVLLIAQSMPDAYRQRREALRPTDWQGHQELAAWCIKHEMLDEAARELDTAEETSPGHATTIRLRGALDILRQRRAAAAASRPAPGPPATRRDDALDRLVESLPDGVVGTFTKSIQPLLVNGCAATACHGPSSTADYRLVRIDPRQAASRYATLRNLEATLKLINREASQASPLLTVPRAPHATAKSAIYGSRNAAQYDQLEAWVKRVAGDSNEPDSKTASRTRKDAKSKSAVATTDANRPPASVAPAVDPFDPSAFNQRQGTPSNPPN
jgi:hypothetical protein